MCGRRECNTATHIHTNIMQREREKEGEREREGKERERGKGEEERRKGGKRKTDRQTGRHDAKKINKKCTT